LFCPTITIDATTLYSAVADFVNSVWLLRNRPRCHPRAISHGA
jgi:hypothetical protein